MNRRGTLGFAKLKKWKVIVRMTLDMLGVIAMVIAIGGTSSNGTAAEISVSGTAASYTSTPAEALKLPEGPLSATLPCGPGGLLRCARREEQEFT
jgi:hypothetical protein